MCVQRQSIRVRIGNSLCFQQKGSGRRRLRILLAAISRQAFDDSVKVVTEFRVLAWCVDYVLRVVPVDRVFIFLRKLAREKQNWVFQVGTFDVWRFKLNWQATRHARFLWDYFLRSFSVLRSSTTYAIEARMPEPERTGARSEISSPRQTGSVREPSPIHACSIFTLCGTFSTSS